MFVEPEILEWADDVKSEPSRLEDLRNGAGHPQDRALYEVFIHLFAPQEEVTS